MTVLGRADSFRPQPRWQRTIAQLRRHASAPAPAVVRRAYETLLDCWPGKHLVATLPGGERVHVSPRHRHLTWNPHEYAAFRAATPPGAVVFDIGANVGAYSLLFAQWIGATGRVIAFEPGETERTGLRDHLRRNALETRIEICAAAVCDCAGTEAFTRHAPTGANSLTAAGDSRSAQVETTTIDEFCARRGLRPAVIKIDVEGAELRVLRGARRVLADPSVSVFVEFHPSIWARDGVSRSDVESELKFQRLRPESLVPDADVWQTEGIAARLRRD